MNLSRYKTTILGLVSAAASFVLFAHGNIPMPAWLVTVAQFAMVGGLAGFGIVAKDYNATGGTVPVTNEAAVRVYKDEATGGGKI